MRRFVAAAACLSFLALTSESSAILGPSAAHHARGTENVFWFLHVSDVHIGSPLYGNHGKHANWLFDEAIGIVQPWFVVVTGDLVDAAKNKVPTAGQVQAEWDEYRSLYEGAVMTPSFYFDLPGNHDGYGDEGMGHYLANSLLGRTHNRLYTAWTVEIPAGQYLFFGFNSAGNGSGPFFEKPAFTTDEIEVFQQTVLNHDSARQVFALAHHPLSKPAKGKEVEDELKSLGGAYYLHGHDHDYEEYLAGGGTVVVNQVASLGAKDTNNVGVGVVDHDGFVYRATNTKSPWPFVVITAPMGVDLRNGGKKHPYAYNVCKDRNDNPVRALVFSLTPPKQVRVKIGNGAEVSMTPSVSSSNLWTANVDTSKLTTGVHDVMVTADVDGASADHKIRTRFIDGPCDPLPEDPPPVEQDAGVDAQPDGDAGDSDGGNSDADDGAAGASGDAQPDGAGAMGGSGGVEGGTSGAGGTNVAGQGGDADSGVTETQKSDDYAASGGGCSCTTVEQTPLSRTGNVWLMALMASVWWRRRRRG